MRLTLGVLYQLQQNSHQYEFEEYLGVYDIFGTFVFYFVIKSGLIPVTLRRLTLRGVVSVLIIWSELSRDNTCPILGRP